VRTGIDYIRRERRRQIEQEGFSDQHDDLLVKGELARAAACYALPLYVRSNPSTRDEFEVIWPWGKEWWRPSYNDRIRDLAKAGALIAAEIDRLQRARSIPCDHCGERFPKGEMAYIHFMTINPSDKAFQYHCRKCQRLMKRLQKELGQQARAIEKKQRSKS